MRSLLKVTSKARLALSLVSELAATDELLSLETIAEKTGVSRKFLEQIAGELRKAKIIEGVRGARGGYRLTRPSTAISVAEVLTAVEGPNAPDTCTARGHAHAEDIISKIQGQVVATLMNTSVAEINR